MRAASNLVLLSCAFDLQALLRLLYLCYFCNKSETAEPMVALHGGSSGGDSLPLHLIWASVCTLWHLFRGDQSFLRLMLSLLFFLLK